jgi:cardiolipin synthase
MSGKEKFANMFEAIRHAKSSVHLEYFNFRNDSIAGLLFDILREKRKEGVEVRALFDGFGNDSNNRPLKKEHLEKLHADSINIYEFDPIRFPWVNHIWPRDHRKIVVIDGRVAYTGGMNEADYYITGIEKIGPWRDMHMHIEGTAVNDLHLIFVAMWEVQTDEVLRGEKYFPKHNNVGGMRVAIVDRAPRYTNKSMRELFISMLDHAQKKVRIVNPYFVPTNKVRKAIKRTIDRGVEVEIMLSAKSDIPLTPDATHWIGRKLAKRGAKVYLFNGGFHHTKVMMVDDLMCTVGSSNLDSRSLRCDYEVNTVIFDKDVTKQLNDMFDEDLKTSDLLTHEMWMKKSVWKRFVAWFGNALTPFL